MHPLPPRPVRLAATLGLAALAAAAGLVAFSRPAASQGDGADIYLPMLMAQAAGPFATPRLAPPPTETAKATATEAGPSRTPEPSATERATNTLEPTATPTLGGEAVEHPTGSGTIILQMGWTQTDQPSAVWEEMNGTPWLTLYGDGHLIASDGLFNNKQELVELQVDEYTIQRWLRELANVVGLYSFGKEYYEHTSGSKPILHVYSRITGYEKLVMLAGFQDWERRGAGLPEDTRLVALTRFARSVEAQLKNELLPRGTPYAPEKYTILVQNHTRGLLVDPPRWEYGLNIRAIAEAAPTAASNYEDHVVAHKFADQKLGEEVRDVVAPEWLKTWLYYTKAAEFRYANKAYGVGVRQEVPGGSLFLPEDKRDAWYRRDAFLLGPTSPRLAAGGITDLFGTADLSPPRSAGGPLRTADLSPPRCAGLPLSARVRRGALAADPEPPRRASRA